jgi:hypothetical protein
MKGHSIDSVEIAHVAVEVHAPYDRFTGALEKTAGRFDKDSSKTCAAIRGAPKNV